jgi:hypothetical protein
MTSVSSIYLADAFAIREMGLCVPAKHRPQLWSHLTEAVEDNRLGFPKEVAEHLAVVARDEQAASWAAGLGASLGPYATNIKFNRPLMKIVYDLGFDQGIESLDELALGEFDKQFGAQYPGAIDVWKNAWNEFTPFLDYRACRRMRVA